MTMNGAISFILMRIDESLWRIWVNIRIDGSICRLAEQKRKQLMVSVRMKGGIQRERNRLKSLYKLLISSRINSFVAFGLKSP